MLDHLIQRLPLGLTRRRIITTSLIGAVAVGCVICAPPVIGALRYDSLISENSSTRQELLSAQAAVGDAQLAFEGAAKSSLTAYADITEFLNTVDTNLLTSTTALSALSDARNTLAEMAGIHELPWRPGVKRLPDPASAPRIPAETNPVTVDGLMFAVDRNHRIVADYSRASERITGQVGGIRDELARTKELVEKVLASAAKYGTSPDMLTYSKAEVQAKVQLNRAIGDLADADRDPITRFTVFKDAVAKVKKSHAAAVAEEERIAREKAEAEQRALEEERIAQEKAEREAKAKAEEAQRALEEQQKQAEEEEQQGQNDAGPTPSPTPSPDHTPAPGPTPNPDDTPAP